jgi:HEAT repeat protein
MTGAAVSGQAKPSSGGETKSAVAAPAATVKSAPSAEVKSAVAAPPGKAPAAVAPSATPAAQGVPVMIPVATTTQRELSPEILENLRLLTGQNSLEARQIGAQRMLKQGSAAVAAIRLALVNQPSALLAQATSQAILDVKDPPAELIDPLLRWLGSEEPEVRAAVIAALASYRDSDLPAKLRAVAASTQNSQTQRLAAVTVLSHLADRDAVETLVDLLDVPEEPIRTAALAALVQLTGVDFGPDVSQWRRWWQANRNRKPQEWLAALNASLMAENRDLTDKVKYLRGQLGKAYRDLYYATPEVDRPRRLISYLNTQQVPEVRAVGIDLINLLITDGKTVTAEVADQLRKTISDPEPQVRLQAIRVLGDLRNRDDARLLLEAFNRETDPATSQAIARALGRLGDAAVIPALLDRLARGDASLAAASAAGLGLLCQRGNTNAVPAGQNDQVIAALKDRFDSATDKALRQELLEAMAKMADERFRNQFLTALQSPDLAYRQIAVKAFADLNGPDDADKILSPLLSDNSDPAVREAACGALAKIGKTRQIALLLQRCDEQSEPSAAVRRAAKDAAISIMLRLDAPALKKELDRLVDLPGQLTVLVDVLEAALAQTPSRSADNRVQAVLLGSLAAAKDGAGQKEAAAALWVRVVTIQPNHPTAIGALARTLIAAGKPDLVSTAIQQIAGGQSGALVEVLTALAREAHSTRHSDPAIADTVRKIDVSGWPSQSQDALRNFVKACGGHVQAATSAPASTPATIANQEADGRGHSS